MANIDSLRLSGVTYTIVDSTAVHSLEGYATTAAVGEAIGVATADLFDGAEYDSATKRINFKHGDTVKAYVDATAFIKDGMVSNVEISEGNLVITFNADSGKEAISIPLTDIFNPQNYYNKTEVDNALAAKANTATTYTKTEVDTALNGKASATALSTHTSDTTVHVTQAEKDAWNGKASNATVQGTTLILG